MQYDQIKPTSRDQLIASEECFGDIPNKSNKIRGEKSAKTQRAECSSVFEAIITGDNQFYETTDVMELLHRLHRSFNSKFKVNNNNI